MVKQVKIYIDEDLWARAKAAAAINRISLKVLYTEAIESEVDKLEKSNKKA